MIARMLATHLWQSTIVGLLAWMLTLVLRRDRAAARHLVWLAASVKFLVPFALLTSLGERVGWRPAVAATIVPLRTVFEAVAPLPPAPVAAVAQPALASTHAASVDVLPWAVAALWAAGAIALLVVWLVRWRRVAAIVRAATPLTTGPLVNAVRRRERETGAVWPIAIASSETSLEPGIVGIVRATLLWPERIDRRLSPEHVDAIVAHELAHVRRRDNLTAAVHMCVQAAFWFHPLVWWIGARLVDERERACDEAVVGAGNEARAYAESLLTTCRLCVEAPASCVAGVTGSDLAARIERIMAGGIRGRLTAWKKCLLTAAACAAIALPVLVGVLDARPALAQTPRSDVAAVVREMEHNLERVRVKAEAERARAQDAAANADATFEVATVKPNHSGAGNQLIQRQPGGRVTATNMPLRALITFAYQLAPFQLAGGPSWVTSDHYDIVAKLQGNPTFGAPGSGPDPIQLALRTLLADRFGLKIHHESRVMEVYALVMAKPGVPGPALKPSSTDCAAVFKAGPRTSGPPSIPPSGIMPCNIVGNPGRIRFGGFPIAQLTTMLGIQSGRMVVDRTGLTGKWEFDLHFAPDPRDLPNNGESVAAADPDAPSLFTALQEQLGLKLEATKGPVDVFVIENVQRPTAD